MQSSVPRSIPLLPNSEIHVYLQIMKKKSKKVYIIAQGGMHNSQEGILEICVFKIWNKFLTLLRRL